MKCPNCGEEMVTDYQDLNLNIENTAYTGKVEIQRCLECGHIVIGDQQHLSPSAKQVTQETPKEEPATPVKKDIEETVATELSPDDAGTEKVSEPDPMELAEVAFDPEPGDSAGETTSDRNRRPHVFSLKEYRQTGHILSDSWLDFLEESPNKKDHDRYVRLISFERRQQRHMDKYRPVKKIVIHDTIIDPAICTLIKTEEIRIHRKYISKRYYFKSPEGYFFSVAHVMNGKDQASELKLSQVKKLFEDDPDLYKQYIPENQYKYGYDPSKESPIEELPPKPEETSAPTDMPATAGSPISKASEDTVKQEAVKEPPAGKGKPISGDNPKKASKKKAKAEPVTEKTVEDTSFCSEQLANLELDIPFGQ